MLRIHKTPSKMIRLIGLLLLALLAFSLAPIPPAHAATIVVDTASDELDGNSGNGNCSLREAISNANNDNNNQMDCAAGGGADIITFDSSLNGMPIILTINNNDDSNTVGDLDITANLTINGNGASNTIVDSSGLTIVPDRVFHIPGAATVALNDLTIRNGAVTGDGGGMLNSGGTVTINRSTISGNSATVAGGGVATDGGGTTTINDSTISGNSADDDGGGISNDASTTTIERSTISGNMTTAGTNHHGGGIRNNGIGAIMTITDSTISGNTADDDGGGIYNNGTSLNIYESTLSGNSTLASGLGDGAAIRNASPMILRNSTISGNTAADRGGAVYNTSSLDIDNVTMSGNTAGAAASSGSIDTNNVVTLDNSILTSSTNGVCRTRGAGGAITGANNLLDAACGTAGNLGMVTGLGTLADNGGPTQTHALSGDSNAIDVGAGGCVALALDQREVTRPLDGDGDSTATCDIGAYEAGELQCNIQSTAPATYTFFTNVAIEITVAGTDLDCLRATHLNRDHPNATVGIQTGQYWAIEALQSDGSTAATNDYTANLTLPHAIVPDTNAAVCKWLEGAGSGGGWDCARTSSTASTVLRDAVPGFSDWAVGDNVGPTAVTLQTVSASATAVPVTILLLVMFVMLLSWRLVRREVGN